MERYRRKKGVYGCQNLTWKTKKHFGNQRVAGPPVGGRRLWLVWGRPFGPVLSVFHVLWAHGSQLSSHFRVEKQQGQPFPYDDWNETPRMKMAGLPSLWPRMNFWSRNPNFISHCWLGIVLDCYVWEKETSTVLSHLLHVWVYLLHSQTYRN